MGRVYCTLDSNFSIGNEHSEMMGSHSNWRQNICQQKDAFIQSKVMLQNQKSIMVQMSDAPHSGAHGNTRHLWACFLLQWFSGRLSMSLTGMLAADQLISTCARQRASG